MPSWNDSSIISALLYVAIGGTLIAVVLLALEYYRQQRVATYVALAIGMALSAVAAAGVLLSGPFELVLPSGFLGGLALVACGAGSSAVHSMGRIISRPGALGALLLIASLLVGVLLPSLDTPPDDDILMPFDARTQFRLVTEFMAVTDLGQPLPVFIYKGAEQLSEAEQRFLATARYTHQIIRIAEPSAECNCHGWVYTGGRYGIQGRYIDELLADNGYEVVAEARPDDLVIYRGTDNSVEHTGLVRHIGRDGMILVESKWGPLGVYLHPLDAQPYGAGHQFYRSPRAGHELAIVPQSSLPEADGPELARSLGPTPASNNPSVGPEQQPARREVFERPILRVPGQRRT